MARFLVFLFSLSLYFVNTSYATENRINIGLTSAGGTADYLPSIGGGGDVGEGRFSFDYTRFFDDLATDENTPYGAREFLQHPSSISIGLSSYAYIFEEDLSTYEVTYGVGSLFAGVEHYVSDTTGISLLLGSFGGEIKEEEFGLLTDKIDVDGGAFAIGLNHYIQDNISIGAGFISSSTEYDDGSPVVDELDENIFMFNVEGIFDKLHVSVSLLTGNADWRDPLMEDDDISGHDIYLGVFTGQQNELYFVHENYKESNSYKKVRNAIGDKVYVSENFFIRAELYGEKITYIDSSLWDNEKISGIDLEFGIYF